ncbi:MAG: ABC transporter permease [Lachnospiraceae bacterium]|nr:ABC transporter permease [Lachnospiraceae bacterium]
MKTCKNKANKQKLTQQEIFVLSQEKHHRQISSARIFLLAGLLILWEISANLGLIDSFFFSSPSRVVTCLVTLFTRQNLPIHIGITLMETLISFFLVFLISLIAATALWFFDKLSEILEPYLVLLNSLPKSALAPLFIVWLGTGVPTIIVAGISVAVFGSIISFYTGFRQVDTEKLILIRTLGGNKWHAFFKVVLPSSVPILLSTTKVNIGLALVGVIIGEFLAARRGLGYLIIYGSQVFQLDMVITSILILCIIAYLLYSAIQSLEHFIKKEKLF